MQDAGATPTDKASNYACDHQKLERVAPEGKYSGLYAYPQLTMSGIFHMTPQAKKKSAGKDAASGAVDSSNPAQWFEIFRGKATKKVKESMKKNPVKGWLTETMGAKNPAWQYLSTPSTERHGMTERFVDEQGRSVDSWEQLLVIVTADATAPPVIELLISDELQQWQQPQPAPYLRDSGSQAFAEQDKKLVSELPTDIDLLKGYRLIAALERDLPEKGRIRIFF